MARGQLRTSAALQWVCLPAGLIFLGQELPTLSLPPGTPKLAPGPRSQPSLMLCPSPWRRGGWPVDTLFCDSSFPVSAFPGSCPLPPKEGATCAQGLPLLANSASFRQPTTGRWSAKKGEAVARPPPLPHKPVGERLGKK